MAAIIALLGARPGDDIDCPDGTRRSLAAALLDACDIGRPSDEAIEVLASRALDLDESQRLQALAEGYPGAGPEDADLLDLLQTFPSARPPVQELVSALAPLQPRLYSIASSPKVAGAAVHLTVATVRYEMRGAAAQRRRLGLSRRPRRRSAARCRCSCSRRMDFRLPADDDAPMVMIGPGTGIAPFRAFLQERRARGARGRNWLFFGDQRRACDFLYEEELAAFRRAGVLTRLELAFSRDQPERVYVQQRMRERAARAVGVARGRGASLRLRQRRDGARCRRRARRHHRPPGRDEPRRGEGLSRRSGARQALSARRLLNCWERARRPRLADAGPAGVARRDG